MPTRAPVAPTALYSALKGATSLFAAMSYTVELIYFAQVVGLNPLQLVLVGAAQQLVSLLMQAPTGAWADVYSRRWAVVLGLALTGAGLLLEGTIPRFGAALAAQALIGLGLTLMDGADAAWIADEIGVERAGPLYLRATQIGWLATLPGIALGAGLGSLRLGLPIAASGGLYLLFGAALALLMPERGFVSATRGEGMAWRQLARTLGAGLRLVRASPALLTILGTGAVFGAYFEAFGQLWQYHLLHRFVFPPLGHFKPIVWFGLIETVITLTNVAGIELAKRRVRTTSHRSVAWALFAVDGAVTLGAVGFALAGQFALALACLWLMTTATGPRLPLRQAWINQHTEANVRATVFSLSSQVTALAAIVGGPLVGALATAYGTRPALATAALLLAPALLLYARSAARGSPAASPVHEAQRLD
jgi:DHA3 family tetracycline resistance protein-like MFS transporter